MLLEKFNLGKMQNILKSEAKQQKILKKQIVVFDRI